MRTVKVYALTCPDTGAVRYIGSTIQTLSQRLQGHLFTGRTGRTKCSRGLWIKALWEEQKTPGILLLEECAPEMRRVVEARWGAHYLAQGADLVNDRPAGLGGGVGGHFLLWPPGMIAQLGKVPDAVIAEQLGVTRKTVSYYRHTLAIPASFDRTRNTPPPPIGGWNRRPIPPEILARLGTAPDYVLAAEMGVSKPVIARERRARGIASYAEQTGNRGTFRPGHYPARWLKDKSGEG